MIYPNSDHVDATPAAPAGPPSLLAGVAPAAGSGSPAQGRTAEQQLLDALYPPPIQPAPVTVPENTAALRKDRPYDAAIGYAKDVVIEDEHTAPEVLLAMNNELRRMSADVGLSPPEAKEFLALGRQLHASPPDEATESRWQAEALDAISRRYGPEAGEVLDLTRRLVARDPRLGKILDHTRLGNHPAVIAKLVERALSERNAGRL